MCMRADVFVRRKGFENTGAPAFIVSYLVGTDNGAIVCFVLPFNVCMLGPDDTESHTI